MTINASICPDLPRLEPEHLRLIALRVQGHSWTKCAAHLGVDRTTVRRWREDNPEIDRRIAEECEDYLKSARIKFASILDTSFETLDNMQKGKLPSELHELIKPQDIATAAKFLLELAAKHAETAAHPQDSAGARDRAANERAGPQLPADVVECDQFADLERPDQHATR